MTHKSIMIFGSGFDFIKVIKLE